MLIRQILFLLRYLLLYYSPDLGHSNFTTERLLKYRLLKQHGEKFQTGIVQDRLFGISYPISSAVGVRVFRRGKFEGKELEYLCKRYSLLNIKGFLNIFDVGAHFGWHSMVLAQALPNSHIFAFEPHRLLFELAKINLANCKLTNQVKLFDYALGESCQLENFVLASDPAYSSLAKSTVKTFGRQVTVQTSTIDQIILDSSCANLTLLKIDVEGAEEQVLAGARQAIKKFRPDIFIEIQSTNTEEERPLNLIRSICSLGYKPFVFQGGRLRKFDTHNDKNYNYLFWHPGNSALCEPICY